MFFACRESNSAAAWTDYWDDRNGIEHGQEETACMAAEDRLPAAVRYGADERYSLLPWAVSAP